MEILFAAFSDLAEKTQQTHDVISTSIRRLCDVNDVVWTPYRC